MWVSIFIYYIFICGFLLNESFFVSIAHFFINDAPYNIKFTVKNHNMVEEMKNKILKNIKKRKITQFFFKQ